MKVLQIRIVQETDGTFASTRSKTVKGTIIYVKRKQCIFLDLSFQMAVEIGKSDACRGQVRPGSFL